MKRSHCIVQFFKRAARQYGRNSSITAIFIICCLVLSAASAEAAKPVSTAADTSLKDSKIAYAAEDGLYCADLDQAEAVLLVKGEGISSPIFSADGKTIAYMKEEALFAYDLKTKKVKLLLKDAESFDLAPKGEFYAASQKSGILAINPETGKSTKIVSPAKGTSYMHLKPSPDLKWLAYDSVISGIENQDKGGTWLYNAESKKTSMLAKATKISDTSLGTRPSVGTWSRDSKKILIWLMSQSASLSADGVSAGIYDTVPGSMDELNTEALAYDENVSFVNQDTLAVITGGSRMMSEGKKISIFDLKKAQPEQVLKLQDKIPAAPYYSADGKSLLFTALPSSGAGDDYKSRAAMISKRQIYMYTGSKFIELTKDKKYRSELPVFLKNNKFILFARLNGDGEKSIWRMDSSGSNQKLIARWKYNDPQDYRSMDFYGRIDWSNMFAIFDSTKP